MRYVIAAILALVLLWASLAKSQDIPDNAQIMTTDRGTTLRVRFARHEFCSFTARFYEEDDWNVFWDVPTFSCWGTRFEGQVVQHNENGVCETVVLLDSTNEEYRVLVSNTVACPDTE